MIETIWIILLLFLPIAESVNRTAGFIFLVVSAVILSLNLARKKILLDRFDLFIVLFLVTATASTLFSTSIIRSLSELIRYYSVFIIMVFLKNSKRNLSFAKYFALSAIGASLLLIFANVLTENPWLKNIFKISAPVSGMNLYYPVFGHNRISDILLFSVPASFGLAFIYTAKPRLLLLLMSILLCVVLFASYSRGIIIALVAAGCIVFIVYRKTNKKLSQMSRWFTPFGIVSLVFLILSLLYSNIIANPSRLGNTPKGFYKPLLFEKRLHYWQQAAAGFLEKPILGSGLDTFRYISLRLQKEPVHWSWYAHNHFLQLFSEVGILGGGFFILSFIYIISSLFSKNPSGSNNSLYAGILIGFLGSVLSAFVDYGWQFHSVLLYTFSCEVLLRNQNSSRFQVSKFVKASGISFFYLLFIVWLHLPREGEVLIEKADREMHEGRLDTAAYALSVAKRLDNANHLVFARLGALSEMKGDIKQAHIYYDETLKRNPLESFSVAKIDFKLYLDESLAAVSSEQIKKSIFSLTQAYKRYPYFHREIHHNTVFEDFNDVLRAFGRQEPNGIVREYIQKSQAKIDSVEWKY